VAGGVAEGFDGGAGDDGDGQAVVLAEGGVAESVAQEGAQGVVLLTVAVGAVDGVAVDADGVDVAKALSA